MVPNASNLGNEEGGLTPLTPDLLNLRQNVTFVNTSNKDRTLKQLVTTKQDKLRDKPCPAPERVRPYGHPRLQDAITLHPGQHIIVDGQRWVLRGQPTISHQPQEPNKLDPQLPIATLPESRSIEDDLLDTYFKCYIPPEINESNAESVEREKEI